MAVLKMKPFIGCYDLLFSEYTETFIIFDMYFDDKPIVRESRYGNMMVVSFAGILDSIKGSGRYTICSCCCGIDGCGGFYESVYVRHWRASDQKIYVIWKYDLCDGLTVWFEYSQYLNAIRSALLGALKLAEEHPDYLIFMYYGAIEAGRLKEYVDIDRLEVNYP